MNETTTTTTQPKNYKELLQKRKYRPEYIPEAENIVFKIQDHNIGSLQNYCIFAGLPKTGKSTFLSALTATALLPDAADLFGMKLQLPSNRKKLAYFDTESADYDFYRHTLRIKDFAAYDNIPERIMLYQVREDMPGTIRKMIETLLNDEPEISVVIIDGLLDLCINYNDEKETRLLTNWIKRITKQYNILLISVIHLGKKDGETLGHLGSNADRWAQSTLVITRNKEHKTYSLEAKFLRSAADFEPIVLQNISGTWEQTHSDGTKETATRHRPEELTLMEHNNLIYTVLNKPLEYKDLISELQAITAKGQNYCKGLVKIWIEKKLITKTSKGYENNKPF